MDKNNKSAKISEIERTKKQIIELRIKNHYYNKHSVIDKVIDEILFEQFNDQESQNNSPSSDT